MKVVVIGSSNIDMVAQVNHLPAPGETVGDASFMQSLGGKGANQCFIHGFWQYDLCDQHRLICHF